MKKLLMLCGVFAALVYAGTVFLGGLLRPGYSHISMAISELVAEGAPNRALLSSLFLVYNVLLTLFGIGLFLQAGRSTRGRVSGLSGSVALILVGLAGVLMELAFPQEPGGTATTFAGTMHFVMAGVASLGTMVAILMLAFWLRNLPDLKGYVAYSFVSVVIVFLSGGMTAAAMANQSPFFGVLERVTILTFVVWVFSIGRKMVQLEDDTTLQAQFEIAGSTSKGN